MSPGGVPFSEVENTMSLSLTRWYSRSGKSSVCLENMNQGFPFKCSISDARIMMSVRNWQKEQISGCQSLMRPSGTLGAVDTLIFAIPRFAHREQMRFVWSLGRSDMISPRCTSYSKGVVLIFQIFARMLLRRSLKLLFNLFQIQDKKAGVFVNSSVSKRRYVGVP